MTKKIIKYPDMESCKAGKRAENANGFRVLYHDFIDGEQVITFVDGKDDPSNSKENKDRKTAYAKQKALKEKLKDDSITFDELKEYMRNANI